MWHTPFVYIKELVMNPKILVSGILKIENYINAIKNAGGDAFIAEEYDSSYDALVLCGGADIDPSYYGEQVNGSKNINRKFDAIQYKLLKAFVEAGKPVLGICRGCQLINIYFDGSLYQHIEKAEEHSSGISGVDLVHNVVAEKGSVAQKLYGESFFINSSHHQAIKKLGKNLRVSMLSGNGTIVEGIEHTELPIIAVQWHPERMCGEHARNDTVDGSKIFEYFIDLCKSHLLVCSPRSLLR